MAEVRCNHGRHRFGEAVSVYRNPVVSEFEIVPTWRIDSRPVDFLVSGLADVSLNTISKLLEDAGGFCASFNDVKVRGVKAKRVQVDEAWSFTYAKQKNVAGAKAAPDGAGDTCWQEGLERFGMRPRPGAHRTPWRPETVYLPPKLPLLFPMCFPIAISWKQMWLLSYANLLISMVGAHGLEPWTR
jgi:hypothetical protein